MNEGVFFVEQSHPIGIVIHVHAASPEVVEATGRPTPSGHSTPSGQLAENQRMARSKLPVVRSRPEAIRSKVEPALNTIVETRARDRLRAAPYASEIEMS